MDSLTILLLVGAGIFIVWLGYRLGLVVKDQEWLEKLPDLRKESVEKSRQVLTGKFSEQLAPYLPDFPFSPTESRFLGSPIDLIVFKGLDDKEPTEVIFVEIKTGDAKLSTVERKLRDAINNKKVSWVEYRIK
ncbi:MAG: Holliday junction resolvase-like protein [Nanoarchaeota archaeon]